MCVCVCVCMCVYVCVLCMGHVLSLMLRTAVFLCMAQVKATLADQYTAGFQPLLDEAEQRHQRELQGVVELQAVLEEKGVACSRRSCACSHAAALLCFLMLVIQKRSYVLLMQRALRRLLRSELLMP